MEFLIFTLVVIIGFLEEIIEHYSKIKVLTDVKTLSSKINIILLMFLVLSCESKVEKKNSDFIKDNTLTGQTVFEPKYKLKFNPPKDWELMETETKARIESRDGKKGEEDKFIYKPLYIFYNDSTLSLLSVGLIEGSDTIRSSLQFEKYRNFLIENSDSAKPDTSNFIKDNRLYFRINVTKANLKTSKIVFQNSEYNIFQFEYTVREQFADKELNSIKSSVGSISIQ